jgi:DNA-binding beta-propeller fold protein YncE
MSFWQGGRKLIVLAVAALCVAAWSIDTPAAEPSLELVQTITLKGKAGKLDHAAMDAKRQRLFVANKVNNTLDIVDLKAGKLLRQITAQSGIQGIAYAADLDRIFVGLGTGGFCNAFDGEAYKLLKTIKFKDDSDNVRYNPKTHLVYVAHADNAIGVIDAKTFSQRADINLPGTAEGFQMEAARPRLYVNIPSPAQVAVVDTDKNEVVKNYPLTLAGGNHPLVLDEANHRLFIGCRKEPKIVIMDSESGKEVSSVVIPGDIDDLFMDATRKRLYASCGEGFIAVLKPKDADNYEVVEKIPTAKQAKTSLFDSETGRLYLLVPRQGDMKAPEVRVYQAR